MDIITFNSKKLILKRGKQNSQLSKIAMEMFWCSSSQSVVQEEGCISILSVTAGKILYTIWEPMSHSPFEIPYCGPFTLEANSENSFLISLGPIHPMTPGLIEEGMGPSVVSQTSPLVIYTMTCNLLIQHHLK